MKLVRTIIVFDQGGLADSTQWARIYAKYAQAVRTMVHPPSNDRFVIRRRLRKHDTAGRPTNQWLRNRVARIRHQFLANLDRLQAQAGMPFGRERGVGVLARADGCLLMIEYPSRRDVSTHDRDWGPILREHAGYFDCYWEEDPRLRCAIKWETRGPDSMHFSVNRLCLLMREGVVEIGVVILPTQEFSMDLFGGIAHWDEVLPYLAVWNRMGQAVGRGLFVVSVVEPDEATDDGDVSFT